jgi:putative ATP-dependent endonuclease of OLD family
MAALHLDVTRSASLFAERLVLVEGISDALVLRQLALRWAGADQIRRHFVDSLTILPIGSKVGEWPVRLLATPEFEMVTRLAVLTDSDNRVDAEPSPPAWTNGYSDEVFIYRMNHPTLEPALALPGNRAVIAHALQDVGLDVPDEVNPATVDALFRRASSIDGQSVPADPGAGKKGDFAYHLASRLADGEPASVPDHITEVLEFIFHGVTPGDDDPVDAEPGGADAVGSADAGIQADNAPGSD